MLYLICNLVGTYYAPGEYLWETSLDASLTLFTDRPWCMWQDELCFRSYSSSTALIFRQISVRVNPLRSLISSADLILLSGATANPNKNPLCGKTITIHCAQTFLSLSWPTKLTILLRQGKNHHSEDRRSMCGMPRRIRPRYVPSSLQGACIRKCWTDYWRDLDRLE